MYICIYISAFICAIVPLTRIDTIHNGLNRPHMYVIYVYIYIYIYI